MAELRKHRDLSEIIFGLGLKGAVNLEDVDIRMLVYPYNAATEERVADPEKANQAYLMSKYGADAINSAKQAAEVVHNGIAPEQWLQQLTRTYKDFKIVNVMHKTQKKIEKDQEIDLEELKDVIDSRLEEHSAEPLSWGDIKDEFDQEWLWPGWLPHGEVTILVGQQGSGKSAFSLYLADCVANGKPLPDGSVVGETMGVLWVETEGRFAENVRRARAWGVDQRNIYIPSQDMRKVIDLTKPEDKALVRSHAKRPEVGLVVIDSLGGSLMDENDASAKKVLQGLSGMAQETNTSFLIIHHLRKPQKYSKGHQRITLADVRGHGGITQFAPSVIAIDYEGHEMPRFMHTLKMNLVEEPPTMTFSIGAMGLLWNETTHDQVRRQVIQETVGWLEEILTPGAMTIKEVKEMSEVEGYDWDIVKQAINFPSIKTIKNHQDERCLSL
jgi:hypothetical protein